MSSIKSIAACFIIGVASAETAMSSFMKYCSEHGKSYSTMEEFEMRFDLYNKAEDKI